MPEIREEDCLRVALGQIESCGIAKRSGRSLGKRLLLSDGRRLVLKHLPAEGDFLTRLTDGAGRTRQLWDSGVLAEVGTTLDHTIVAMIRCDGIDTLVMRDVSDVLLTYQSKVSHMQLRQLMGGLAKHHHQWEQREIRELCPLSARYRLTGLSFVCQIPDHIRIR